MRENTIKTIQSIINAAMHLIARGEYASATMRQIAKVVGITTEGVYAHFKSKTEILIAIQTKFIDEVRGKVNREIVEERWRQV